MVSVLIKGEFLDIGKETKITFRIRHNLYDGTDPSIKRGSYTLPFTVKLTDHNKKLLEDPHLKDNRNQLLIDEPAVVYISNNLNYGMPFLYGKVYISDCNDEQAECSVVTQGLNGFGDITFDKIPLGAPPAFSSSVACRVTAKDTLVNPDNYNYSFIPVTNYMFTGERVLDKVGKDQNPYDITTQEFVHETNFDSHEIVTPFIKITYLLKRAFEHIGISLINEIENNEELNKLYLHHVNDMWTAGDWPLEIPYNKMCPDMKVSDFYKQYCAMLFLGIFPDPVANKVEFRPWKDVINATVRHDWTNKVRKGSSIKGSESIASSIQFGTDGADERFSLYSVPEDPDSFIHHIGAKSLDVGDKIYNEVDGTYLSRVPEGGNSIAVPETVLQGFAAVDIGGVSDPVEIDMIPIMSRSIIRANPAGNPDPDYYESTLGKPMIAKVGTFRRYQYSGSTPIDEEGESTSQFSASHAYTESTGRSTNARVIIHRGMKTVGYSENNVFIEGPCANHTSYDPDDPNKKHSHAITLDGEEGLVAKLGAEVIHFMRSHKKTPHKIDLDVNDILNIKEYDKVRVDNMQYLISEYEVTVEYDGINDPANFVLASIS